MRGSFGHILQIAAMLLLLSLMTPVLASGETWEFCGTNSDMSPATQCFDSREKAEAWIRTDPASGPKGRKYLEQDGPVATSSFLNSGLITFIYSIKPRGPKEVRNDDYGSISHVRTGNPCSCNTAGQVECYVGDGPCPPDGCRACAIPNGDITIFKNYLLQPRPDLCNLRIEDETGYPSPPISSNDLIVFPNTNQYAPSNYGFFSYTSGTPGYYKQFTRKYETTSSQCQTTYSATYQVNRNQIFICDIGFYPKNGQINWRGGEADPYRHVEYNEVCQNGLKASITARKIATKPQQCPVGNPCDPVTGAKTQHESDLADTSLPLRRSYNSLRSVSAYDYFGPGWHFNYAEKLLRYTGTPSYMLRITDEGMTERYDWSADRNAYLSATQRDALIRAAGAEWELLLPRGERRIFDAKLRLVSIENLQQPNSKVIIAYTQYETAGVPAGAITSVTDNSGRSLRLSYSIINPTSTDVLGNLVDPCENQASPSCRGWRVTSISTSDGQSILYAYDLSGNLRLVGYADGNGRQYHYNEFANICPTGSGACEAKTPPAGGFPHHLTGISAGPLTDLQRLSNYQYDFAGRAISTALAGGKNQYQIKYMSGLNDGLSEVTDPLGNKRTFTSAMFSGIFSEATQIQDTSAAGTRIAQYTYQTTGPAYRQSKISAGGQRTLYQSLAVPGERTKEAASADGSTYARSIETDRDPVTGLQTERRTFDASGVLMAKTNWTYNPRGQTLTSTQTDPVTSATRTTSTTYCEAADVTAGTCPLLGLVTQVDGPRTDVADVTSYTYYPSDDPSCATAPATCPHRKGDLWKTTNALGQVTEVLAYDGAGRALSLKDANGVITDMEYHPRGWLTARKLRGPDNSVETDDAITRIAYFPTGLVQQVTQPDGSYTRYTYDPAQRLTGIADNAGNTITYTLDNAGNRTAESTKDPTGSLKRSLSRVYDQLGQLSSQSDAYSHATGYTYDADGNTNTVTDALGRITDNDYDPLGRLSRTLQDTAGIQADTRFQYDALDNLTQVTDPKGLKTSYAYNGLSDLTRLTSPDTGITTYTVDAAGNRKTQTDARGITSTYSYDALHRLTAVTYPTASENVSYTYDAIPAACPAGERYPIGRLSSMTDPSGSTAYCYDRFGQLVRKVQTTNGHAFTLRYGYSAGGRLQTVTYPDGAKVDYLRNALGQISQVGLTRAGGSRQIIATQITHAPFGPVTGWTDGGSRVLTRAHNLNYQPQSVRDAGAGGLDLAFEYDPAGNLNLLKNGTGVAVAQYGYDALNRLTQTKDGPTGTPIETYGYDKTGNRTSLIKGGVTTAYTYPAASHRLGNVGGVNRGYSAAGNLTSIGSTQRQFTYNNANRLSTAKANGATTGSYRYNGKGEQVRQYLSTANTYSLHDEAGHWLGDYSTPSNPRQQAIWLDDLPIGLITGAGVSQSVQYLQPDHLGSPRVAIDAIRNKAIWTWDLKGEAFGNTPPNQDPDGDGQAFVLNLRYPGQRWDAASGLNQNGFRDYEAATGRYPTSDPVGQRGGINTYAYANNSPLTWFDPDGLTAGVGTYPGYYPPRTSPAPGPRPLTLPGAGAGGLAGCLNPIVGGILLMMVPGNIGQDASCSDDPMKRRQECRDDDDEECAKRLEREETLCRLLAGPRYPGDPERAVRICQTAAFQRYAACLRRTPESDWPPLTGIDTPI